MSLQQLPVQKLRDSYTGFNGAHGCVPDIFIFIDRFTSNLVFEAAYNAVRQVWVHKIGALKVQLKVVTARPHGHRRAHYGLPPVSTQNQKFPYQHNRFICNPFLFYASVHDRVFQVVFSSEFSIKGRIYCKFLRAILHTNL
jgi:hypothetical protein